MVDFRIVPERTALINVDLQNCFVEGAQMGSRSWTESTSLLQRAVSAELL
jgi:nicotinamidase-related amidase